MYDFARLFTAFPRFSTSAAMSLTREQIESIAHLARLELKPEELAVYQQSLSRIIDFVGELERASTADVMPMAHPLPGLSQRLREDVVTETDRREELQANAPQTAAGLYIVPKVIE